MFKILGAALAVYTLHAAWTGRVFAKDGIRMRSVMREDAPGYFRAVIGVYAALSLALLTVF